MSNSITNKLEGLRLHRVTGFCSSILENKICKWINLVDMELPVQLKKYIRCNGTVFLKGLSGDVNGLLENISCDHLIIDDLTVNSDTLRSTSEMISSRVSHLEFDECAIMEDFTLLTNYDGQGCCEKITFNCEDGDGMVKIWEKLVAWADSIDWTIIKRENIVGNDDTESDNENDAFNDENDTVDDRNDAVDDGNDAADDENDTDDDEYDGWSFRVEIIRSQVK